MRKALGKLINRLKNLEKEPAKANLRSAMKGVIATVAALSFLAAAITIVATLTFTALPVGLNIKTGHAYPWPPWVVAGCLTLLGVIFGFLTLAGLEPCGPNMHKRAASDLMFTRYLIGLGYFLFADAIINMVAFAGFARSGILNHIFPLGDGQFGNAPKESGVATIGDRILLLIHDLLAPEKRVILTVMLVLSLGMAVLGALFFFANALWAKFKSGTVIFDRNIFWAGLWFRLAEAIVFTIAIFLFLRFQGYNTNYMPIIALFIGMTVKSSEGLIFGLADRLSAAMASLAQPRLPEEEKKVVPVLIETVPQELSPKDVSNLIRRYLGQTQHRDKIKSVETSPSNVADTFLVKIKVTIPNDNQRPEVLISEVKKAALSASRTKNVKIENLEVVIAD